MKDFSYITHSHPAYIEGLYNDFVRNPESVDPEFRKFFEGFDFAVHFGKDDIKRGNGTSPSETRGIKSEALTAPAGISRPDGDGSKPIKWEKELGAYRMILGYRNKGHLVAKTNPIRERKDRGANIDPDFFGFKEEDMDQNFQAGNLIGLGTTSLRNIIQHLQKCYAHHVGIEFKYISNQKKIDWLTNEIEKKFSAPLPLEKRKRILEKLNQG